MATTTPSRLSAPRGWTPPRSTSGAAREDQDAFDYLRHQLDAYGISTDSHQFTRLLWDYLEKGFSTDRIMIEIQETKTWKERFAANEARRKKGLPVLSPAEYIGAEASFRQIMQQAGMPKGFYDSNKDFQSWLENDVSPQEVQQRVTTAQKLIEGADPRLRDTFEQYYTPGDLVAYALDPKRTADLLEKQAAAAEVGAAGRRHGFTYGGDLALERHLSTRIGEKMDAGQASAGFGQARRLASFGSRASSIYGGEDYDDHEAIEETFFDDEGAAATRRKLASQERAAFSGRSGLGDTSLSRRRAGSL